MFGKLKERVERSLDERINRYVRARFERIQVLPIQGLFNFRCFDNVVEYRRTHPGMEVVEVIYMDGGGPVLHYLNYDPVTRTYQETTMGYKACFMEYYLIRTVPPEDHHRMFHVFEETLDAWADQWTTWWQRNLFGIRRVL